MWRVCEERERGGREGGGCGIDVVKKCYVGLFFFLVLEMDGSGWVSWVSLGAGLEEKGELKTG